MFNSQQEARAAGQQTVYDLARHFMWVRRGDSASNYPGMTSQFQPELQDYVKAKDSMQDQCIPCTNVINIPSDITPRLSFFDRVCYTNCEAQQEKENNMYAQATVQMDQSLAYINRRLTQIRDEKIREAHETFRMIDDGPRTIKELKAALKAGDYKIKMYRYAKTEDDEDIDEETLDFADRGYNWTSMFQFNSKKDEKGFRAFQEALKEACQKTQDHITIVTDEKSRLKALEEFQAWKN